MSYDTGKLAEDPGKWDNLPGCVRVLINMASIWETALEDVEKLKSSDLRMLRRKNQDLNQIVDRLDKQEAELRAAIAEVRVWKDKLKK